MWVLNAALQTSALQRQRLSEYWHFHPQIFLQARKPVGAGRKKQSIEIDSSEEYRDQKGQHRQDRA